jgi:hypothetical protein
MSNDLTLGSARLQTCTDSGDGNTPNKHHTHGWKGTSC